MSNVIFSKYFLDRLWNFRLTPTMSATSRLPHVALLSVLSPLWMGALGAAEPPELSKSGLVAEIWPLEKAASQPASQVFEMWRSRIPPDGATTMQLDGLRIPARESPSMVRVRGVLVPPLTGGYAFLIEGADAAQLWLLDDATGEWTLAQRDGNPNGGPGRNMLEEGVPKRFEFQTMGSKAVSVEWKLLEKTRDDPSIVRLATEVVPAARLGALAARPGDRLASGLPDEWKQKWGLALESGEGPGGPFGDPDGDGLLNGQEMLAGTDPLTPDAEGRDGLVRWEIWRNVPGKYVFDLTRSANFPQHPDELRYLSRLESPVGYGNDYGARLRGLVKPPAGGEYTFTLTADDTAELWLGETESWQSKRLIAKVDQAGTRPRFPEQFSVPITLEKGRRYYVEVLHKQRGQADYCSVSWVLPGGKTSQIIGGDSLASWKHDPEDADDDGLPDAWQKSVGLLADGVDPGLRNAWADADHDGISNWEEWKAGTNPLKPDSVRTTNMLTCETWTDLPGSQIKDLVLNGRYPAKPDHSTLIDNMDLSDEGENYGCRLRGYLTASDNGPHTFYVSSNDTCILYLAESKDKFTKHVVARTFGGTAWRSYDRLRAQQSEPVQLTKGRKYYVELLFKRGARQENPENQRDHSSVAWKRPDRSPAAIGAEFFSPYQPDPRDADDDDLPDDFEKAHSLDPGDPSGDNGAWGDPDGDGLENFLEFQAGLDPKVADVHGAPGFALWECWTNIPGGLQDFKTNPAFPLNPAQRNWLNSLEGPQGLGKSYGSRIRAFLVPPATGDYTLAVSGDNDCELWLSPTVAGRLDTV